jgi:hypothetical protein
MREAVGVVTEKHRRELPVASGQSKNDDTGRPIVVPGNWQLTTGNYVE